MFTIYTEIPYINVTAKLRVARDLRKITRKAIKMGAKYNCLNIPDVTRAPAYMIILLTGLVNFLDHTYR